MWKGELIGMVAEESAGSWCASTVFVCFEQS